MSFWEPGGDVIHYQAAHHLDDRPTMFVAVMVGIPGEPMLTLVDDEELAARRHLRAPQHPTWRGSWASSSATVGQCDGRGGLPAGRW
ncbi:hypothetical protein [Nocardioides sp.]|uniref:hypothetical protein n=1 Tax=Nocardioides sp. TaxID=35761 RepID=UPI002E34F533|nr:hypothetical protein [Nocardioides sp.]